MKLKVGTYADQYSLGVSYVYFNKMYKAIVLDLIFFYIDLDVNVFFVVLVRIQIVDEIPKTISEKFISRVLKNEFSKESDNVFAYEDFR